MSWSRSRKSAIAAGVLGLAAGAGATALCGACSSAEKLAAEGGSCFLVTDCQDGLVCVPKVASQPNGARVCSNNVSSIVPGDTGTAEPDAGGIPTTLPTFDAQPVPDALVGSDAGAPEDATTPPPQEAAPPPPPMEASSPPPMEASTPPVEASAPPPADASSHD